MLLLEAGGELLTPLGGQETPCGNTTIVRMARQPKTPNNKNTTSSTERRMGPHFQMQLVSLGSLLIGQFPNSLVLWQAKTYTV